MAPSAHPPVASHRPKQSQPAGSAALRPSQQRAGRRREQLREQRTVGSWLRELARR